MKKAHHPQKGFGALGLLVLASLFCVFAFGVQFAVKKQAGSGGGIPYAVDFVTPVIVSEMKKISTALELYGMEHDGYPPIKGSCTAASALAAYLAPNYIEQFPDGDYQASVGTDGTAFVLRAKLAENASLPLAKDIDGAILGCECDDPYYCVTEYQPDPEQVRAMEEGTYAPPASRGFPPEAREYFPEEFGEYGDDKNPVVPPQKPSSPPVACTMDAKICPDGSAVGRTGSNCEFAPCSSTQVPD